MGTLVGLFAFVSLLTSAVCVCVTAWALVRETRMARALDEARGRHG